MSMEYCVYTTLTNIPDGTTASVLSELNKFDMVCEIHPDVSIETSGGFAPFKFQLHESQFPDLEDKELISGVEICVHDFDPDDHENPFFGSDDDPHKGEYKKTISFYFTGASDRFEFRFACLISAILTTLLNGVRSDDDWNISKGSPALIVEAWEQVKQHEEYFAKNYDIPFHQFEGWH